MKDFYNREWSLSERILTTALSLCAGIIIGFLFSPIKKGIYCGNHNGGRASETS